MPEFFQTVLSYLNNLDALAAYVRSLGAWGPLASLALMLLQSVIAPIPGALIIAANGMIYGPLWGTLLSWVGALLGASAAFWIARLLGAGVAARLAGRLVSPERLAMADSPAGFWAVLLARLIPGLSFDIISYLAGLSRISYRRFIAATAIGTLPSTAIVTVLGNDLLRAQEYGWRAGLLLGLLLAGALFGIWYRRRQQMA